MIIEKILKYDNKTETGSRDFERAPKSSYIYFKCEKCGEISSRQKSRFLGNMQDWLCKKCKTSETLLEKYGVDNISNVDEIKEKKKSTMIKNYGNSKQNIINGRKTKLEKYGDEYYNNIEKIKATNLKKYRVEYPLQSEDIREKAIETNLEKYGVEYYNNREKARATILEKYGINNAYKTREIKNKIEPFDKLKFYANRNGEQELVNFLKQYAEIIENDRELIKPQEIDILIPSLNLAIEYNGEYWHSEQRGKDKRYHLNKQKEAAKKGISLIHVFENEWELKRDIVKSILLNKIGIYEKVIYGRKTEIREIGTKERRDFFDNNHIQGDANASIQYGLYYENELVSVMSFGKSRFSNKYDWELIRFANKLNYKVHGSFSKLLKVFRNKYEGKIITYADKRYFNGNVYEKNGFTYLHDSDPNYWYFKGNSLKLFSRVKFQKHKLEKLLESFDPALSEYENMVLNGYDRIWDCGNHVYVI